jgi:hypothetical protein
MNCSGTKFRINNVTYYCTGNGAMVTDPDRPLKAYPCQCTESSKIGISKTIYWVRHINQFTKKESTRDLFETEINMFHKLTVNKSYWISGNFAMLMYHYMIKYQKNILFAWGREVEYSANMIGELCNMLSNESAMENSGNKILSPYNWFPGKENISISYSAQDIQPSAMEYINQFATSRKFILVSTNRMLLSEYTKKHNIITDNIIELHI